MVVASRTVKLQTRESKKRNSEIKEHRITESIPPINSVIGETTPQPDPYARFWNAAAQRNVSSQARSSDQRWIDDPIEAQKFIRGLISGARQEVLIADGYFGGEELGG
jgi:phosphatidylserine/phosphatidylglycerophosphate/cardiolipin synthase-like enzyme